MSNYLKKLLFTVLILMIPYMNSTSKAMDDGDYERSSLCVHKVNLMTNEQKDVSSSVKQSTSSPIENLEDSQTSWVSYLIFPVKATFQTANEFMNFATRNPKLAMVVGVSCILPAIEALTLADLDEYLNLGDVYGYSCWKPGVSACSRMCHGYPEDLMDYIPGYNQVSRYIFGAGILTAKFAIRDLFGVDIREYYNTSAYECMRTCMK